MWISSGVAIRLAQSIGLHRDGTHLKLSVFATEIRRRLWWQVRMLDIASAEDCGFIPSHIYGEDILLPLNINDEDISPTDTDWPSERDSFTSMTYSLIRVCTGSQHKVKRLLTIDSLNAVVGFMASDPKTGRLPWASSLALRNKSRRMQKLLVSYAGFSMQNIFGIANTISLYKE